ncbi:acyl-CoA N-acyltransferase [Phyllosticta citriasiana]|uniref:acyl-CoA N-acyltransferase n=1 Tax=Phyllosticta citriasiana TaxID=595635 RepID=UPI0030FD6294
MAVEISPMTEADIDGAVDVIQAAFEDDPYANWVFDKATSRTQFNPARNRDSLTLRCHWGIANAIFHIARDTTLDPPHGRILGVAMWLPPNASSSLRFTLSLYTLSFRACLNNMYHHGRGGLLLHRYRIWKSAQAAAQAALWTDARGYYFCNIVAVAPEAQGRGVGRALMGEVLARADQEGRRCYLESSRDVPNTAIYGRMGFEVRKVMECDDGGEKVDLFCMVRWNQYLYRPIHLPTCLPSTHHQTT